MKTKILFFILVILVACKKDPYIPPISIETSEMIDPRDGQKYKIVKLGEQWWMAQNLNFYTKPGAFNGSNYYNNDSVTYSKTYGRLYYWDAAMVGHLASSYSNPSNVQGISPPGWHIPSDAEWSQLETFLMNNKFTGNDLKEVGTDHWKPSNQGTNLTKFNALPAGTCFYSNGTIFANVNGYTTFLSSSIDTITGGIWGRSLDFDKSDIRRVPIGQQNAWSLRCVMDNN